MIDKSLRAGKKVVAVKPMTMTKEQFDKLIKDHMELKAFSLLRMVITLVFL